MTRRANAMRVVIALLVLLVTAPTAAAARYDLGVREVPQPDLQGKFAQMPVRLWGAVAAPSTSGPHPVVLVAHGAHGDGCPGEFGDWPCFDIERRNDLGLEYLVDALAQAGFVAIAPDVNSAYTGGWGEIPDQESKRFRAVADATLAAVAAAGNGEPVDLGVPLAGRVDLTRVGVLGHSRGGLNVLRWASGNATVKSAFLLAPAYDRAVRPLNVPTTLVLGTCDGDTGLDGAGYLRSSRLQSPAWKLTVGGANHNFYNRTLRDDDAAPTRGETKRNCRKGARPTARAQQDWLARVAADHFAYTLLVTRPKAWQRSTAERKRGTMYGRRVVRERSR